MHTLKVKSQVTSSAFVTLQPVCCLAVIQFLFNFLVKILRAIDCVLKCSDLLGEVKNPFLSSQLCAESHDHFRWVNGLVHLASGRQEKNLSHWHVSLCFAGRRWSRASKN